MTLHLDHIWSFDGCAGQHTAMRDDLVIAPMGFSSDVIALDLATGTERWKCNTGLKQVDKLACENGIVVALAREYERNLVCLIDLDNGEVKTTFEVNGSLLGVRRGYIFTFKEDAFYGHAFQTGEVKLKCDGSGSNDAKEFLRAHRCTGIYGRIAKFDESRVMVVDFDTPGIRTWTPSCYMPKTLCSGNERTFIAYEEDIDRVSSTTHRGSGQKKITHVVGLAAFDLRDGEKLWDIELGRCKRKTDWVCIPSQAEQRRKAGLPADPLASSHHYDDDYRETHDDEGSWIDLHDCSFASGMVSAIYTEAGRTVVIGVDGRHGNPILRVEFERGAVRHVFKRLEEKKWKLVIGDWTGVCGYTVAM